MMLLMSMTALSLPHSMVYDEKRDMRTAFRHHV